MLTNVNMGNDDRNHRQQTTTKSNKVGNRRNILIAIAVFLVSITAFGYLAHEVVQEKEDMFDSATFLLLAPYTNKFTLIIMRGFSFFGSHLFLLPAYALIVLTLCIKRHWRDAVIISAMAISSYALMLILKDYFHRSRPNLRLAQIVNNYSFPSGHAFSSFVFATMLIHLVWQSRWNNKEKYVLSALLVLFSAIIGISRIVLKVHYASDVIAGFCIGMAWIAFIVCLNALSPKPNNEKALPKTTTNDNK
ncbi:phosphatase PAP2 family protein [Polluticoccus soli]|uniref:phosphatase PAP2 family protein n=1 Tax=Polluticoccus soli TaxID=3034150 RepID=UPI0023E11129|nr:phosphatase PAP2 family protein [Flavipsychrobacter sp. JY13-12]